MLGESIGCQERLFYEFNLADQVPSDHLLSGLDAVLDLSWLRAKLAPFYSHTGRTSIDPELIIRMLLVGYCYSIRWERHLCQDVELNLAYRWFCRLGLKDAVPDHSTFSLNRRRETTRRRWKACSARPAPRRTKTPTAEHRTDPNNKGLLSAAPFCFSMPVLQTSDKRCNVVNIYDCWK